MYPIVLDKPNPAQFQRYKLPLKQSPVIFAEQIGAIRVLCISICILKTTTTWQLCTHRESLRRKYIAENLQSKTRCE